MPLDRRNLGLLALLGGLGTLAANRPGVGGGQAIGRGLLSGIGAFQDISQQDQISKLRDLQIAQAQAEGAARDRRGSARSALFGGFDPTSGVTFNSPRPGAPQDRNVIAQAFPDQAAQAFASQAFPQASRPVTLSPGAALVDPSSGRRIADNPKEAVPFTDIGKASSDLRNNLITPKQFERISLGVTSPKDVFDNEDKLRDEFVNQSKDFVKVRDSFARIQASASDPSAAGDLALIFNYMKVLDPGSTVREGEFATAQQSAGVPDQVRNIYNQILQGTRLGVEQRADFVNRARKLFTAQQKQQQTLTNSYSGLAERNGLDPRNIIIDLQGDIEAEDPSPQTAPEAQPLTPEETQELQGLRERFRK